MGGAPYYYSLGYDDFTAGRKARRVPQNFKLAYLNGRSDARAEKPKRMLDTP